MTVFFLITFIWLQQQYLHFTWRKNKNNVQESFFVYDSLGTTEWNWNRGLYDKYVHVALFCHNDQVQQYYENIFALVATTPLY